MKEIYSSLDGLLNLAIETAVDAGESIMNVYNEKTIGFESKPDTTPLTLADKIAHNTIESALLKTGLPVLSEEGIQYAWDERKLWVRYWLVDPLDGTKEFLKKNGEFTVNIALVEKGKPTLGVVFAPALGLLYYASEKGAYKTIVSGFSETGIEELEKCAQKLPFTEEKGKLVVVASRSHFNNETNDFINRFNKENKPLEMVQKGSSLKLCLIAEGSAHLYPRFGPTMEWDTAAGHAVLLNAGKQICSLPEGEPLKYNKEDLYNPSFYAF